MRVQDRITALLLIASLLFTIGTPSILLGWLKLDHERIVQTLCEQRAEADNTCQGQCHMNKVLKKTEDASDQGTSQERERIELKEIYMMGQFSEGLTADELVEHSPNELSVVVLEGYQEVLLQPPISA